MRDDVDGHAKIGWCEQCVLESTGVNKIDVGIY